ncbi:unnamed protein product [Phyllotreta striolata]|uniref:Galectin n=1 Tax=Phyllotreta striolata TaxID=444603 RepID=A0A9N9TQZ9_PHYSR|nr:unnamed protein product [Phyllotreta striolata]
MPDVDGKPTKSLNKRRCGCSVCCFPSYNLMEEEDEVSVEHENRISKKTQKSRSMLEEGVDVLDFFVVEQAACPHYVDDLPDPLEPGTLIKIKGLVLPICSRFAINLTCSRDPGSDIALHVNPRISQRYVVRNSRVRHLWGQEEVTTISNFELNRNEKFQIDIVVAENEYFISINGKHVCAFVHRIPLTAVKTLLIEGPVEIHNVEYGKTESYPVIDEDKTVLQLPPGDVQEICTNGQLRLPLTLSLPQGFKQGWQLEIDGRVKILPVNFFINLQDGSQLWPHPNIHLHLNPRFGYANTKHMFVRNAWMDGQWGNEECTEVFPFEPAAHFKMAIRRSDDRFGIWVNGRLSGEFKFRGDADRINTLYMQGDVTLNRVCMKHCADDKYLQECGR